jgi:hypothetical protein
VTDTGAARAQGSVGSCAAIQAWALGACFSSSRCAAWARAMPAHGASARPAAGGGDDCPRARCAGSAGAAHVTCCSSTQARARSCWCWRMIRSLATPEPQGAPGPPWRPAPSGSDARVAEPRPGLARARRPELS